MLIRLPCFPATPQPAKIQLAHTGKRNHLSATLGPFDGVLGLALVLQAWLAPLSAFSDRLQLHMVVSADYRISSLPLSHW